MIDFACKQFNMDDVLRCVLGLTKTELDIYNYFFHNPDKPFKANNIANRFRLNLTTVQKATKKLHEKNIIIRNQNNLPKGGYVFTYELNDKIHVKDILKKIVRNWSNEVEKNIEKL